MCSNKLKLYYSIELDLENEKYVSDVICNRFSLQPLNISFI